MKEVIAGRRTMARPASSRIHCRSERDARTAHWIESRPLDTMSEWPFGGKQSCAERWDRWGTLPGALRRLWLAPRRRATDSRTCTIWGIGHTRTLCRSEARRGFPHLARIRGGSSKKATDGAQREPELAGINLSNTWPYPHGMSYGGHQRQIRSTVPRLKGHALVDGGVEACKLPGIGVERQLA